MKITLYRDGAPIEIFGQVVKTGETITVEEGVALEVETSTSGWSRGDKVSTVPPKKKKGKGDQPGGEIK